MFGSIEKIITAIGGEAIAYNKLAKAGDFGPWALKPLETSRKSQG
jgi:hypothetical protein